MHPKQLKTMPFNDSPVEINSIANPVLVSWGSHNCRLSGLNNRNVLSHHSGGWSSRSRCWQGHAPSERAGKTGPRPHCQLLEVSWLLEIWI